MYAKCVWIFLRFQRPFSDTTIRSSGYEPWPIYLFSLRQRRINGVVYSSSSVYFPLPVLKTNGLWKKYIYIKTRIIKFHDSITTRDLRINLKLSTNFEYIYIYISPRRYSPIINGKKKKKRSIFTPQLKKLQYIDTSRQ